MEEDLRCEQWKIEVNDRFQKLVDLLIGLATGALVLPTLFLKEYLGVPAGNPLLLYLDSTAILSIVGFLSTILLGKRWWAMHGPIPRRRAPSGGGTLVAGA